MEDDPKITLFGVTAIIAGIAGFFIIKFYLEPWVIEIMCRELVRCG